MTVLHDDSKIDVLAEDFDLFYLLEENDISVRYVIQMLVDEGLISLDDYIDTSNEVEEIKRWEE